jgi:hypothetical protein
VLVLSFGGSGLIVAFGAQVLCWWLRQDMHLSEALLWAMAAWIAGLTLTNVPGIPIKCHAQTQTADSA